MTTHKKALDIATGAYYEVALIEDSRAAMEAAIRAYIDARGRVMVPREPTPDMLTQGANEADISHTWSNRGEGITEDSAHDVYQVMLAAAPDPFK